MMWIVNYFLMEKPLALRHKKWQRSHERQWKNGSRSLSCALPYAFEIRFDYYLM